MSCNSWYCKNIDMNKWHLANGYRSTVGGLVRRKLKKDRCDEPKPAKYDMNMRRNDVYDGI